MSEIRITEAQPVAPAEAGKEWRCFHCDFVAHNEKEAYAHFGDRDDAEEFKPICNWWAMLDADGRVQALQDAMQQIQDEQRFSTEWQARAESAESKLTALSAILKPLKALHEECQPNGDRSPADVYYARVILRDRLFDALPELLRVMER